ncbi:nucleoside transporter C-terminal domain-containing protein [Jeotgalibacillus sp. ET6]|uniref:NupC/NupG family nucleoside CNT transporter n=1 Tax=Jeotgalibacillus sp. ET6 TaxID=3037260 RepID=UPI0024188996|nr:nucleoside transporter C-terminal domain-containing protein [Jeotgalibacillus sp. ET6]MDG5473625.1 nucleoside transporter C-terminal domain-containing protein [Jeotgalibacillus sp. ET6]
MNFVYGIFSLMGVLFLAWLWSSKRSAINWRIVLTGIMIEFLLVLFVLKVPFGQVILNNAALGVQKVIDYSTEGIMFVFGGFYEEGTNITFVFAINVLGAIIFISAIISALYYLRIIPLFVKYLGIVLGRILGTTKVESFNAIGNSFLGLVEAPLLIKPYLIKLTRSEVFAVMVGGTASASGAILIGYSLMGIDMKLLLISVFSVPLVSLVIAKVMEPETEESQTNGDISLGKTAHTNVFEAIADGALNGTRLAINIGGLLIAFIGILALINGLLGLLNTELSTIFGYIFYPLAILIGIPMDEAFKAASIIGTKLSVNEFVAFSELSSIMDDLSPKTVAILTVALCNFANLSSIGQLIVGLGSLEPSQQKTVSKLSFKAIVAGTLASFITAIIVSLFL